MFLVVYLSVFLLQMSHENVENLIAMFEEGVNKQSLRLQGHHEQFLKLKKTLMGDFANVNSDAEMVRAKMDQLLCRVEWAKETAGSLKKKLRSYNARVAAVISRIGSDDKRRVPKLKKGSKKLFCKTIPCKMDEMFAYTKLCHKAAVTLQMLLSQSQ